MDLRRVVLLVVACVVLAGCGGGNPTTTTVAPTASPTSTPTSTPPSSATATATETAAPSYDNPWNAPVIKVAECGNPEIRQASVCLDFTELTDMVNTADADADVHIRVHEHDIEIDVLDLDFSLTLIDPETLDNDQAIPDLDLPAEVVISSSAFKRGIKAGNLVAEHIEFGISETDPAFYMRARGDSNEVVMEKEEEDLGALTADSVSSTYSLNYLTEIGEAVPTDTHIGINLGDDHPAEISFDLVDGNATVTYFLAPRLEPDS